MRATPGTCFICSWLIEPPTRSGTPNWSSTYRAVCLADEEYTFLSEIAGPQMGRGPFLQVPLQPGQEWTDRRSNHGRPQNGPPMMRLISTRSFACHAHCWTILARHAIAAGIEINGYFLRRVWEVCYSTPCSTGLEMPSLGHDYGGLARRLDKSRVYPWEDQFSYESRRSSPRYLTENPISAWELKDCIKGATRSLNPPATGIWSPQMVEMPSQSPMPVQKPAGNDVFLTSVHPLVCNIIAEMLSTQDVMSLRRASKAFWHVFHQEYFWATRFIHYGHERSWLWEARESVSEMTDTYLSWKARYHSTKPTQLSAGLQNRIRIWNTIPHILACTRVTKDDFNGIFLDESYVSSLYKADFSRTVRALINSNWRLNPKFYEGCRLCRRDEILLPGPVSKIVVYFVTVGITKFVCGFETSLLDKDDTEVNRMAGYRSHLQETLTIGGSGVLYGVMVAVGSRGIHALQFLSEGMPVEASRWAGNPQDFAVTRRLVKDGEKIHKLTADLDGCKLVSLAVCLHETVEFKGSWDYKADTDVFPRELRTDAIWYPSIPDSTLHLNADSFLNWERHVKNHDFRPLFWTHFGGPGGTYLKHLTAIVAEYYTDSVLCLRYEYDNSVAGLARSYNDRLGQDGIRQPHISTDVLGRNNVVIQRPEQRRRQRFEIDGPDGEYVDCVELMYMGSDTRPDNDDSSGILGAEEENYEQLAFVTFKLSTNRGRSCLFCPDLTLLEAMIPRTVKIASGTIITGFYAEKMSTNIGPGLGNLGVISEMVPGLSGAA